jgi:hypothetical protein
MSHLVFFPLQTSQALPVLFLFSAPSSPPSSPSSFLTVLFLFLVVGFALTADPVTSFGLDEADDAESRRLSFE